MNFFIGNCCLKLNSFVCGSNESSLKKKKRKFKIQVSFMNAFSREISI